MACKMARTGMQKWQEMACKNGKNWHAKWQEMACKNGLKGHAIMAKIKWHSKMARNGMQK